MPHRIFTDVRGVAWDVWDVVPRSAAGDAHHAGPTAITGELARGWLAFQSPDARRRLAPIPFAWDEASDEQLRRWCTEALAVVPRQPRGAPAGPGDAGAGSPPALR
jgi:hypothetical protein